VGWSLAARAQQTGKLLAIAVDPVGSGMVASLARPGGNATGISVQSTELAGKRLEILREALPNLRRLAMSAMPARYWRYRRFRLQLVKLVRSS
jgi:ABC-type uncharacterized transport system substrate-binding protein